MLFTPTPKFATIRTRRPSAREQPRVHPSVTAQSSPSASRIARASASRDSGASSGFSSAVEQPRQPRLDRLGQLAGDDDARPPAIHTPSTIASVQAAAPCRIALSG